MLTFTELQQALRAATAAHVPFYRKLYDMKGGDPPLSLSSYEEWSRLPFVTKEMLLRTPLRDRLFVPLSQLDSVYASSGTTGAPLFSPRQQLSGWEFRAQFHEFTRPLLSAVTYQHKTEYFFEMLGRHIPVVSLDIRNIRASLRLANAARVDSAKISSHVLVLVGEEMRRLGIAERIRFLEVGGGAFSRSLYDYARKTFPHAVLTSTYGASEVECSPPAISCRPLSESEPFEFFHANAGVHFELIHPDTGKQVIPEASAEGELVVTSYAGTQSAFPLLRYRIGDMARIYESSCVEHGTWSFSVLGRKEADRVKIPGGLFMADEIERVLRLFPHRVGDRFALHYRERAEHPFIEATLHVEFRDAPNIDIASDIAKELRIGPSFTFAQGVAEGLYAPLRCAPFAEAGKAKRLRIVRDVS